MKLIHDESYWFKGGEPLLSHLTNILILKYPNLLRCVASISQTMIGKLE